MNTELSFDVIAQAWKRLLNAPDKINAMKTTAPDLLYPEAIRLKNVGETNGTLRLRFYGFEAASESTNGIPIIKRMIVNWLKKISDSVQTMDSTSSDLNVLISTSMKFTEAAITIYQRDPKTNKVKRKYKCIGGKKDGKRVSDPNQCLQYPDVAKKISLSISKRAKYGQRSKARTKTKLTNIVSKKVRKANQRLKNARGL